jgi:hypothetical protein
MDSQRKNYIPLFLIVCVTLLLYWKTFSFQFVWDDEYLIRFNPHLLNPPDLATIFGSGFWKLTSTGLASNSPFYRPLVTLAYIMEHRLFGMSPGAFHAVNLLVHLLCIGMLWKLCERLGLKILGTTVCGLMFALHPVQVHTVSFVASLGDVLTALFSLLAIYCWTFAKPTKYLTLLWIFLAMLCKEVAVVLPLVIIAYDILVGKKPIREISKWLTTLVWVPYFAMRIYSIETSSLGSFHPLALITSWGSYRTFLFIGRMLFPIPNSPETTIPHIDLLWRCFFHVAYLGLVIILLMRTRANRFHQFLIVWTFASLFIVGDWFNSGIRFSDQLLYYPLISFSILAGSFVDQNQKYKKQIQYVMGGVFIVFVFISSTSIKIWENNVTLWQSAVEFDPTNASNALNYGSALFNAKLEKEGCQWIAYSIKLLKDQPNPSASRMAYYNAGNCHLTSKPDWAEKYYAATLMIDPSFEEARKNLILSLIKQKKNKEASDQSKILMEKNPDSPISQEMSQFILKD